MRVALTWGRIAFSLPSNFYVFKKHFQLDVTKCIIFTQIIFYLKICERASFKQNQGYTRTNMKNVDQFDTIMERFHHTQGDGEDIFVLRADGHTHLFKLPSYPLMLPISLFSISCNLS